MTDAQESVNNELEHLVASARDALTDDMVTRLSATAGDGLDLLDRVNRSGIDRALPAIAQLVENGDLDRLVGIARLIGAAEDSMSDDIVNRLALIVTGLASLVDKLARNDGFLRLLDLLGREDVQDTVIQLLDAAAVAKTQADTLPPAKGGVGGLWRMATDPSTQEALQFLTLLGKEFNKQKTG